MKKVSKTRREKVGTLEEKKLTVVKGSSGYTVIWGIDGEEVGSGEGTTNP